MKRIILIVACALFSTSSFAVKLAGVDIADTASVKGQQLSLNGAGVRTKFVFDIYVAAFYTKTPVRKASTLNVQDEAMRIAMHFVYDEVSKEKLVDAWNEGFEDNISEEQLEKLRSRIKLFNSFFITAKAGDVIYLDYVPSSGTIVTINNKHRGKITGNEFYHALLMIWLGDDPVGDDLKDALLGISESEDE